ncbi:MAG: putative transitional endoplasmic reticulum ATPase, partial [Streblomastix strix]
MRSVDFKVVKIESAPFCFVVPDNIIHKDGDVQQRKEEGANVGYDDICRCKQKFDLIQEVVGLRFRRPQLFKTVGVKLPRGILLFGPPGTGKYLFGYAVANATGVYFIFISYFWKHTITIKDYEYFKNLFITHTCHMCQSRFNYKNKPTLVRIDNAKAHTKSNVLPCCLYCN